MPYVHHAARRPGPKVNLAFLSALSAFRLSNETHIVALACMQEGGAEGEEEFEDEGDDDEVSRPVCVGKYTGALTMPVAGRSC